MVDIHWWVRRKVVLKGENRGMALLLAKKKEKKRKKEERKTTRRTKITKQKWIHKTKMEE